MGTMHRVTRIRHHLRLRKKTGGRFGTCEICGVRCSREEGPTQATLDHIIPLSRGGTNNRKNIQLACHACNQGKADDMPKRGRGHRRGE